MISQTVEYALRAMSHLAAIAGTCASSSALAEATHAPHGYLSKIMRDLVCAQLVTSYRGRHGGFALARDPDAISVLDIVNAVSPRKRAERDDLGAEPETDPLRACLDGVLARAEDALARATLRSLMIGSGVLGPHTN